MYKITMIPMLLLLSACATIEQGNKQEIVVNSEPAGAICTLTNKAGSVTAVTPKKVTVERSGSNLEVYCAKGAKHGSRSIVPGVSPKMSTSMGLIGSLPDVISGAGNEYDNLITVELK